MGLTYDVLKTKLQTEHKLTLDELLWLVDKVKELDRGLDSLRDSTNDRLHKIERLEDDHIPGGI